MIVREILAVALRHSKVLSAVRPMLEDPLVTTDPFARKVLEFATSFWDEHKVLPKSGDLEVWCADLDDGMRPQVSEIITSLARSFGEDEKFTPDYIASVVTDELRDLASRNALATVSSLAPDVPPEIWEQMSEKIRAISPVTMEGILDVKDVRQWAYEPPDAQAKVTTGSQALDGFLGGGFKNELVFIMADSGIGKTSMLINHGYAAATRGAQVFHVTLELSARNTLRRYYRRISEADQSIMNREPAKVVSGVEHWLRFAKGGVKVLYRPAYELNTVDLHTLVEQFVGEYGSVDMVILDYLDLMKQPAGSRSEYEALGQASHIVRSLCTEFECSVLSATQASRVAHNRRRLRIDMMGDSYKKVQAADVVLGLAQTEEEQEANQGRISLLKVRESQGRGFEIPMYINLDYMLIADLDHPNTQRIVSKLGHQSTPLEFGDD